MTKSSEKNIPTIVVCIDTTNASEVTLKYACYKARLTGFGLKILAVMEASHKNLLFGSKVIGQDKRKRLENHLQKLLSSTQAECFKNTPDIAIREGDIVTEIVREIKSTPNCAMLIFGKSHNSMSDNTVLPKIAQRIGDKIRVPVMIVPENLDEEFLKRIS
jgi:nucleotide-binding universal stress UspA family protein